jgi:hypothetical protein
MRLPLVVSMLTLVGCSTSTTSTEVSDTSAVPTDTVAMTASDFVDEAYEEKVLDTTYTMDVQSAFTGPQLNERVAYVYNHSGLDVFETQDGKKIAGHIDYKSHVDLSEPLINSVPSDTMLIDGLRGRLVPITFKEKPAYVFSGYLLNLPVPDEGLPVIDYFSINLHLIKPAVREATECECEMASSSETFEYENGITVINGTYYEGGGQTVDFRNRMTFQEVYLFAGHFLLRLAREVPELPKGAFEEEKDGPVTIKVSARGERISDIAVHTAEGCVEEEEIHERDNFITMSISEGC